MRIVRGMLVFVLGLVVTFGCTPRVIVRPNPSAADKGVRYYRPKPYLLVSSATQLSSATEGKVTTISSIPDARYVNIQLQYMPDFSEEYSIQVRSGLGLADVSIQLEDGWNLTSINQKLDSKTSENVNAAANLLKSVGGLPFAAASSANENARAQEIHVRATNIPLGYYESVIGRDSCGKKQLYGFRYIGFMPFQSCPTRMSGSEADCCQSAPLYGLVFEQGVMIFKPIAEIANNVDPTARETITVLPLRGEQTTEITTTRTEVDGKTTERKEIEIRSNQTHIDQ